MGFCVKFKAIAVRVLFGIHILICVWRLSVEEDRYVYWLIAAGAVLALILEGIFTLGCTKHGEWRRFIPCIFIYLAGTLPTLCLLEWSLLEKRIENKENDPRKMCSYDPPTNEIVFNIVIGMVDLVNIPLTNSINWTLFLEQIMVFLLVVGRWLLPKGKMSRDRLSYILLAYIGSAADILEFLSEGVQTTRIACIERVVHVMLIIWSVSLVLFTLELSPKVNPRNMSLSQINETFLQRCGNVEVWDIMLVMIMQDGPFLGMRLYLIGEYQVYDQGLIFFTFKNILVIMLQMYRLWILLCPTWDQEEGRFSFRVTDAIRQGPGDTYPAGPHMGAADNAVFQYDNEIGSLGTTQMQAPGGQPFSPYGQPHVPGGPPQSTQGRPQSPQRRPQYRQGRPHSRQFQGQPQPQQYQGKPQFQHFQGQPLENMQFQHGYNNNMPPQQTTGVPRTVDGRGQMQRQPQQKRGRGGAPRGGRGGLFGRR